MIIGRKKEKDLLEKAYNSKQAEFVTVFGRRRVGKTFLIREFYAKKDCIFFHSTCLQKSKMAMQLRKFTETVSEVFFDNIPIETPKTWGDALSLLQKQIAKTNC